MKEFMRAVEENVMLLGCSVTTLKDNINKTFEPLKG